MEVHAHSSPAPGGAHTPRKKWTHYFWEFSMLFLAVFAGFLAENQREHIVEHKREKEFMKSMLSDLRSDTAMMNIMNETFSKVVKHIDSLIPLIQEDMLPREKAEKIYQHSVYLNYFYKWTYTDRTINQLKNSGSFRLVRNKTVSDMIMAYDGFMRNFVGDMQDMYILPQWRTLNETGIDIFKSSVFRKFLNPGFTDQRIILPAIPYFLSTDKTRIQRLSNLCEQYAVAVEWFIINVKKAGGMAVTLDSLIKKEYHLE